MHNACAVRVREVDIKCHSPHPHHPPPPASASPPPHPRRCKCSTRTRTRPLTPRCACRCTTRACPRYSARVLAVALGARCACVCRVCSVPRGVAQRLRGVWCVTRVLLVVAADGVLAFRQGANVSRDGRSPRAITLARDWTFDLQLEMEPHSIAWFVFTDA